MLVARPAQAPSVALDPAAAAPALETVHWIDLIEPSDAERALVERLTGLAIPSRGDLEEIESSSRLYRENNALYLSTPLTRRREGRPVVTPLGIVVSARWMLTVRFIDFPSFDGYARAVESAPEPLRPPQLLLGLLEAITERLADVLEHVGGEIDGVSQSIFADTGKRPARHLDQRLRSMLQSVGRHGDTVSMIRDSLLGLTRMVLFVAEAIGQTGDERLRARLKTVERDLRSLSDYDAQITSKVQFLLDATLGFINIEQNNGIRIVTVASIIGIAPTLIASIYGMNFKNIPELNWTYGYYYALTLMALSILAPLAWFRRLGWI